MLVRVILPLAFGVCIAATLLIFPAYAQTTRAVTFSIRRQWMPTEAQIAAGQRVAIVADGRAQVVRLTLREMFFGHAFDRIVGPAGTYLWPLDYHARRRSEAAFPLPTMTDGPAPAFGLIGKIGEDGPPFYVGARYRGIADRDGLLWLGINDDDVADNRGAFQVRIAVDGKSDVPQAPAPLLPNPNGRPTPGARVLLLYVDGLRPDVLHEMADQGLLPNISRTFLERGVEFSNAFTTFPSNTLTANGALFTGRRPDRTGLKSQNQFERTTRLPRGPVTEWLPHGLWLRTGEAPRVYDLLDKFAPEPTHQFLRQRGIPTLASRLDRAYRGTILPVAPMNPPTQWVHHALNAMPNPLTATSRIPAELDLVNARYVTEQVLGDPEPRVIAAWFPMVDKVSHHAARGQFGAARRELARFDRFLGDILQRLRQVGWEQATYLILVSDHGHVGGERQVNRSAHLAREFFHERLGCNVRVVGQEWKHPGNDPARFVFIDHQAWAQAAIFLPAGSYAEGPWKRNTLRELMRYQLGPNLGRVNLLEALGQFHGVDVMLVKLDDARVLVHRSSENQALIHREVGEDGIERYRYEPVRQVEEAPDGQIHAQPPRAQTDPLNYVRDPALAAFVAEPHQPREWLRATAATEYPDAVVGIATLFGWKPPVAELADARDPDLVVTAARGWTFRTDGEQGTDHGSPLREAMRICLFVSGPGIRSGVSSEPRHIVDVLPTIFDMIGQPVNPQEVDGEPLRGIYE